MATAPGVNERPVLRCWGRCFPDSVAAGVALNDQQKMALVYLSCWESTLPLTRSLCDFEPKVFIRWRAGVAGRALFQRTATRQQWVVQRLNDDAVNATVKLRLLTVFQHVAYPARVCTVADKNAAVT